MKNNMKSRFLVIFLCLVLGVVSVGAQGVAIKTNLLYDLTATVNAGVEVGLSPKWTLDVSGNYNAWTLSNDRKWKHWLVQPEARYWFCDRFAGHFLGFHLLGGQYNIGGLKNGLKFLGTDFSQLSDHRFQGWMAGAGVAYGYTWVLGRYWNLEAEIGLGYIYSRYDKFECAGCGQKTETGQPHHYLGPTKAAVNLIYVF
nr:DUF3575 domain-containing protein [uncultured Bacteroides sp.]